MLMPIFSLPLCKLAKIAASHHFIFSCSSFLTSTPYLKISVIQIHFGLHRPAL